MTDACPFKNFAEVDELVWRCERPDAAGFRWLAEKGAKKIVNLELTHDDASVIDSSFLGLTFIRLPTWEPLALVDTAAVDAHVRKFLAVVDAGGGPIVVHCHDGANRTGIDVAAYELLRNNEPVVPVIANMLSYRGLWGTVDATYIRSLDARRAEFAR
jgi:hypothetical protein